MIESLIESHEQRLSNNFTTTETGIFDGRNTSLGVPKPIEGPFVNRRSAGLGNLVISIAGPPDSVLGNFAVYVFKNFLQSPEMARP